MRKRWKIPLVAIGLCAAAGAAQIAYIELACSSPLAGDNPAAPYKAVLADPKDQRGEARTWLTYPEWHIVYSADSFGAFLKSNPPSAFPYFSHIAAFWRSTCAVNRIAANSPGAGDAKVMIYTIGLSYSAELGVKAVYENTLGRVTEWIGGWDSAEDRYAAKVQQLYGAFMHETPWYQFPFGRAFSALWDVDGTGVRHWERRLALSAEYGVKAGYAKAIGAASGAALGADERNLRMVVRAHPATLRAIDPRFRPLRAAGPGLILVEAPRYAQFTILLNKLAQSPAQIVEIAGNNDIFVTVLLPEDRKSAGAGRRELFAMPLDDRPGWRRVGLTVPVARLLPLLRDVKKVGGRVEHVYDY